MSLLQNNYIYRIESALKSASNKTEISRWGGGHHIPHSSWNSNNKIRYKVYFIEGVYTELYILKSDIG